MIGVARPARLLALATALAAASCSAPQAATRTLVEQPLSPPAEVLFHDVAVFTGLDDQLLPHQDVVVRGDQIVAVGPSTPAPPARPGLRVVEGAGRTLLPGLVDAHVHITGTGAATWAPAEVEPRHNLEGWLYAGVTTIYNLAGQDVAEALEAAGTGPRPRVFWTGVPGTGPGSHPVPLIQAMMPWPFGLTVPFLMPGMKSQADAEAFVEETAASGAHFVKLMYDHLPKDSPRLDKEVMKAAIEAAHRRGLKVFVHIGTAEGALDACRAGADVLAHGPYRGEVTVAQAEELADLGCPVIYTMTTWQSIHDIATLRYQPTPLAREISPPTLLDPVTGKGPEGAEVGPVFDDVIDTVRRNHGFWQRSVGRLHEAGVTLLVGTDSPLPGTYPGSGVHEEMRLFVEAGVPPIEVLKGATVDSARALLDDPSFGTVEVGKVADLLLVEGDPTVDITATADIVHVMKDGQLLARNRP